VEHIHLPATDRRGDGPESGEALELGGEVFTFLPRIRVGAEDLKLQEGFFGAIARKASNAKQLVVAGVAAI
jgi:hypothetical protein